MGIYNMSEVFLNKSNQNKADISFNTTTSSAVPEWLTILDENSDNNNINLHGGNNNTSSFNDNDIQTVDLSATSTMNNNVFVKSNDMLTSDNNMQNITDTLTSTTHLENRLKQLFSNTSGGGKKKKRTNHQRKNHQRKNHQRKNHQRKNHQRKYLD